MAEVGDLRRVQGRPAPSAGETGVEGGDLRSMRGAGSETLKQPRAGSETLAQRGDSSRRYAWCA
jgi:hypothetical protein